MIIRSKAPLRLGLAGGGTDVSPYCDIYGGSVLNVTINMYAYCTIEPTTDNKIIFEATDRGELFESEAVSILEVDGDLILHKGIYNRIVKEFNCGEPLSLKITTYSDAPAGSGLGSSSTMVVAILKAFTEWLSLPLGEYDMAKLAYDIERKDLKLSGGKQDQYAATFGGLNFMEFYKDDLVIVNPLRIKRWLKNELENQLILYYTGTSRDSAKIIDEQIKSVNDSSSNKPLESMHQLKNGATDMKSAILVGDFDKVADSLKNGWLAKKMTSPAISNSKINDVYEFIMANGARAAKISGAGGGGYMMILCDPRKRMTLINKLKKLDGIVQVVDIVEHGAQAWTLY